MIPTASEMVGLAHRYCALVEASGIESAWLKEVALLLPRLRSAIRSLEGCTYAGNMDLTPDLEARFELYTHLVGVLGDRDAYWDELDRVDGPHVMTGSLADDLTDIYCELKHGLRMIDNDLEHSLRTWAEGFARHWGQHLIDAERHLSVLASEGRLD